MGIVSMVSSGFVGDPPGDETEENVQNQGGGDIIKSNRRGFRIWGALKAKIKMSRK